MTIVEAPLLNEDYPLSQEQITSFRDQGHLFLHGVADRLEVEYYRPVINQAVQQYAKKYLPLDKRDTYGKAFIQVGNVFLKDSAVARFTLARRFARIAAQLMGVKGVRIYHDQALFKEPGGGLTPWHQDQIYWPVDTNNMITMWMPLVDIPAEVGTMTFVDGSNKLGYLNRLAISDESHRTLAGYIEDKGLPQTNYGAMNAGDATFHYGWTIHSAPGNPTGHMREVMTIIYYEDGTRILEPDSKAREKDLHSCFPGQKPGDIAGTEINPLVYSEQSQ